MTWALVISFIIGAFCAIRLPILIFTLIVILVVFVFALTGIGLGYSLPTIAFWSFLLVASLEAGCAATHAFFYVMFVRRQAIEKKRTAIKIARNISDKGPV
ncbi:hypothetical protein [Rhizobium sp. LC145]|jgi:hypothetical protein|uniref:hypothetical protein n=1 Tax=Rhizobium sp. LC145 TaxID=1120688 RepID=UPI00062A4AEF|nr:hypothetical protein [Rhizobium sp. LC145]KKX24482.1 hypothetical protein YH62_27240 [Rhizobium sp. LC145]TKT46563.1 hypothetical protein FDR95_21550 [Rhizobiaceae bacterium LC148]